MAIQFPGTTRAELEPHDSEETLFSDALGALHNVNVKFEEQGGPTVAVFEIEGDVPTNLKDPNWGTNFANTLQAGSTSSYNALHGWPLEVLSSPSQSLNAAGINQVAVNPAEDVTNSDKWTYTQNLGESTSAGPAKFDEDEKDWSLFSSEHIGTDVVEVVFSISIVLFVCFICCCAYILYKFFFTECCGMFKRKQFKLEDLDMRLV